MPSPSALLRSWGWPPWGPLRSYWCRSSKGGESQSENEVGLTAELKSKGKFVSWCGVCVCLLFLPAPPLPRVTDWLRWNHSLIKTSTWWLSKNHSDTNVWVSDPTLAAIALCQKCEQTSNEVCAHPECVFVILQILRSCWLLSGMCNWQDG